MSYRKWTFLDMLGSYTTMIHVTLHVSDVTDQWNSLLADVMFIWRHDMATAVQRNYQTSRFSTILLNFSSNIS